MELCIFFAICVPLLIGISIYSYRRIPNFEKISFKESIDLADMPIITFKNNGKKINFLLDTGATFSNINVSCLHNYKWEKSNNYGTNMGIDGKVTDNIYYVNMQLEYKDTIYEDEFMPMDLDAAFTHVKGEKGVTLHGILGVSFFEKYQYCLDFKEMVAYSQLKKKK